MASVLQTATNGVIVTDRLTVGVAARLSRYLQVLTQAKKMGKERISSQEMSDYTNINATQIRRDLSAFGKFGKRGVGYNIDSLLGEIRKILRTQGQHNIALVGAGRLGQAIASSSIFAEHGINIAAVFDRDPDVVGRNAGGVEVQQYGDLKDAVRDKNIIVGVLAVPATAAQGVANDLVDAGREDHLQLQRGAARRPGRRAGAHLEPRGRAAARVVLPPRVGARNLRLVRILLWHGYLLSGTGSNVYTQAVAREWGRAGHEVVVFCQEPEPERFDLGGAEVVRPEIGRLLPVFVIDRYEGLEPVLLQDMSRADRESYVTRNVGALAAHLPADVVFANHVLMGGAVAAGTGARFVVKAHGSELEYSMRGNAELEAWGARSLAGAAATFVGSAHIREVLEEVVGHVDRVHEVPPGVDVDEFRPRPRGEALAALIEEARADPPNPGNRQERLPDEDNARRLAEFFAGEGPVVVYFGKLLYNKGVHVLFEALRGLNVRTLVVGFGDYRLELERIAPPRTLFTGPFEHRHLIQLLPLADVAVVPSIFPEAFGMVAAEAAATGCPPLVARHSGLEEIAQGLEEAYPADLRGLASFETGNSLDLADKLHELLALPAARREELAAAARKVADERWSWAGVAERLLEPLQ